MASRAPNQGQQFDLLPLSVPHQTPSIPQPLHDGRLKQSFLTILPAQLSCSMADTLNRIWTVVIDGCKNNKLATLFGVVGTIGTIFTIASYFDTHLSTALGLWTSRKDFIELCENNSTTTTDCDKTQGERLGAPPNFERITRTRPFRAYHDTPYTSSSPLVTDGNIVSFLCFGVPVSLCVFLAVVQKQRLARVFERILPGLNTPTDDSLRGVSLMLPAILSSYQA
ncbi:hypothetical protein PG991_003442 [Apiospora marii]|uniref:Autophagy-related protein n=1 Tax=Apiospora marii TaxID=335849 RepID=A0ABR1S3V5_9PEZI